MGYGVHPAWHEFETALAKAGHLTNFREAEKIGHDRLPAPVLVRAVRMQAIATATGFQIDQGRRQVIATEKPRKCPRRLVPPFDIAIRSPRCQARRDRCGGFQRLLIERPRRLALVAETFRTDRPENTC